MIRKINNIHGRRILHVLSPVNVKNGVFISESDSNFQVAKKTIDFLPNCHHYLFVPEKNDIRWQKSNVTFIKFPYAVNAVSNRTTFNNKEFSRLVDIKSIDVDYIFCHQPELLLNINMVLSDKRYGEIVSKIIFFHWVDCPISRGSPAIPHTFMRQLEAINLADKVYFHTKISIDFMKSNFKRNISVKFNEDFVLNKTSFMPLSSAGFSNKEKIKLPDKKIILFNHRWNQSTGINRFEEYINDIDINEYIIWCTSNEAPKKYIHKNLTRNQYQYLIENSYCSVCFVDGYATWNMSVQDGINFNKPVLVYRHPIMEYVLGKNYPYYFKTKEEFLELLKDLPEKFEWKLPKHDEIFKNNLIGDMENQIKNTKKIPSTGLEWLYCIRNGIKFKREISNQTQPNIATNSNWQYIRRWLMFNYVTDDYESPFTKYTIKPEKIKEVDELLKAIDFKLKPQTGKQTAIFTKVSNKFFNWDE